MAPNYAWSELPKELLQAIFVFLDFKSLRRCSAVSFRWRCAAIDNYLWKPILERHYLWFNEKPQICSSYFDEFVFFFGRLPKNVTGVIDDFEYPIHQCAFSNIGRFFAVAGDQAHFCVYQADPLEFIHERCLSTSLGWTEIRSMHFSPDDKKLLINGRKMKDQGEVAVFSVTPDEVHFVSRIPYNPYDFEPTWFDDKNIIIGECYELNSDSHIATSLSQLWLCSVPEHKDQMLDSGSTLFPLLRFLNNGGHAIQPLISDFVSPRFRRVLQLTEEAKLDGTTLADKVAELQLRADIEADENDMAPLKKVLDMEQECFDCYLKHIPNKGNKEEAACHCYCHQLLHKLLIYVSGRHRNQLCFKLIDSNLLNEALAMKRFQNTGQEEDEAVDGWDYVMKRVDQPDYYLTMSGSIEHFCLSPDHKNVYISIEGLDINNENEVIGIANEIKMVNLEKMIVDPIPFNGKLKPVGRSFLSASDSHIASFSAREILLWSRHHRGPYLKQVPVSEIVQSCSLHPHGNLLATVTKGKVEFYEF